MARYEDLTVRLRADDKLTGTVRDAAGVVDRLDGETADVRLDANDQATPKIRDAKSAADRLDGTTATVKVDASGIDDLVGKLDELPGLAGNLAGALSGAGGAAGGVLAVAGGLFAAAQSAADMAIDAATTAELTGAAVEDASRLQSVWGSTGADVNDLNDVLLQMNGVLGDSPEIARQLGVKMNDGKDIAARFVEVVDAINTSTLGASDKAALMAQVFGEEGVRQVGRLTTIIGTDLQGALDDVSDTRVVSDEDVAAAVEMEAAFRDVTTEVQNLVGALGKDLVPILATIAEALATEAPSGKSLLSTGPAGELADALGGIGDQLTGGLIPNLFKLGDEGETAATKMWLIPDAAEDGAEAIDHGFGDVAVDALGGATDAVGRLGDAFGRLEDELDMERAIVRFREAFARALEKTSGGVALTGSDIVGLKDDILAVAEYAKLTPAEVRALLNRIDQGDVNGVVTDVNNRLASQHAKLPVDAVPGQIVSAAAIGGMVGAVRVPIDTYLRTVVTQAAIGAAVGGAVRLQGTREP